MPPKYKYSTSSDINLHRKVNKLMVYNYKNGDFYSLHATRRCFPLLHLVESESSIDSTWTIWTKLKSSYKPLYVTKEIIYALYEKETIMKTANLATLLPFGVSFTCYAECLHSAQ